MAPLQWSLKALIWFLSLQIPPILRILILCEICAPQTFSLFHSLASQVRRCREGIKPSLSWWNLPGIFLLLFPFILEPYLTDHCQGQRQRAFCLFFLLVVFQLFSYIGDSNVSVPFHLLFVGLQAPVTIVSSDPIVLTMGGAIPSAHKMGKGS